MQVHCIDHRQLVHFLQRPPWRPASATEGELQAVFREMLDRADEFVPSAAGSIFLDDPLVEDPAQPELVLVACFGAIADRLVGLRMPTTTGIAGAVYRSGRPYRSVAPAADPLFEPGPIEALGYEVRSVICAPLEVGGVTVGVLELLNRLERERYTASDLELLRIFARTISASLANAVDAQRAMEMSRRDDLTGLYNDRHLHHSLSRTVAGALVGGSECGLIFLDLDHFKGVNDRHGHLVGSRVLSEVGGILRQILPGHAVAARYGGDEFVVVAPGSSLQETLWIAETIRLNIEEAVFLESADVADPVSYPALRIRGTVTCSLGVATLDDDVIPRLGRKAEAVNAKNELMRVADANMYLAKAAGRNRIVYGDGKVLAPMERPGLEHADPRSG